MNPESNSNYPISLSVVSNEDLWMKTYSARNREREALDELLELLLEVDRRGLHLERGFSSMFAFLEKGLGYDTGSAYRRWMALRAIRETPSVREQLREGTVTLSAVAMTESHLGQVRKLKGISTSERHELFEMIQLKTKQEVEILLAARRQMLGLAPERRADQIRRLDAARTELSFEVGSELMEKLSRLRELFFHRNPGAKLEDLFLFALRTTLKSHDPQERSARRRARETSAGAPRSVSVSRPSVAPQPAVGSQFGWVTQPSFVTQRLFGGGAPEEARSDALPPRSPLLREVRPINLISPAPEAPEPTEDELLHHPAFVLLRGRDRPRLSHSEKDAALDRAHHRCEYRDARSGKQCEQTAALEIDHRVPLSQEGENTAENLQVLCWGHHAWKSRGETPVALGRQNFS